MYLDAFVAGIGDPPVRLVVIIVEELPIPTPLVNFPDELYTVLPSWYIIAF